MNKIVSTLIFLIFLSSYAFGQKNSSDSVRQISPLFEKSNETQTKFYQFQLEYGIQNSDFNSLFNVNQNNIWLWTSYTLSNNQFDRKFSDHTPRNILSPLYNQYMENSKFNPVRYVLGMAEAGAVGYLAYKHIKKYGFWK